MPDVFYKKLSAKVLQTKSTKNFSIPDKTPYVELQVSSNFSFLRAASHPEELITQAAELGYQAIGLTDLNTLAGIVRAHAAAQRVGIPFLVGSRVRISLPDSVDLPYVDLLLYPRDREAYAHLCSLLTLGKQRAEKSGCRLQLEDYFALQQGLVPIIVPDTKFSRPEVAAVFTRICSKIKANLYDACRCSLALTKSFAADGQKHFEATQYVGQLTGIPLVVTNDVQYHHPGRKPLQDVLSCIRTGTNISQAGSLLSQNSERYLKSKQEMYRLFHQFPEALQRTVELSHLIGNFSLSQLRYEYPDEICPPGINPYDYLSQLTWRGANKRYLGAVPEKVKKLLQQELELIRELHYEKYFLTCYDIVRFARIQKILCQGRGAAANSAVCFCLGITSVDPDRIDTLFARFVSRERDEPPDIDIDFEHERREEVLQYIYQKYGRDRAALTCEVVTYRHRSAVREVGKALGLSLGLVNRLAKSIHRWTDCALTTQDLIALGLNPQDLSIQNTITLSKQLLGFPRHLSQHVGGFIISQQPLSQIVPIVNAGMPNRTIIEWDKDDIEVLGMLKIDCLGLGMLSCIRRALGMINHDARGQPKNTFNLATIPAEDPAVYRMISNADTIGVFQIESRAQMSMLPRLKPACFYDLVIEVAIVRPGPIQGKMVHPYLKRRAGQERFDYPDERVKKILGKTLGVPLFQEQAMRLAICLANFTPGEAEQLRRAMAAWKKNKALIATFREKIMQGMLANGYSQEFAENCFQQLKGFSEYGFPESHAASFALLVYASAWLKKYYPAEFAAALLNSQPMGFYAPSQIIQDAQAHAVVIKPIDVNYSDWDCSLESESGAARPALRLGMRMIRGLVQTQALLVVKLRQQHGSCSSIAELWQRAHSINDGEKLRRYCLQALARADAFQSLGLNSRQALWEIRALPEELLPLETKLFSQQNAERSFAALPQLSLPQSMFNDYRETGLSLKTHPIKLLRAELSRRQVQTSAALQKLELRQIRRQMLVKVAGISIVRQRPGTAKGMVFITLEDETGMINLLIRPQVFENQRQLVIQSSALLAEGGLQRIGPLVYLTVQRLESLDELLSAARFNTTHLPSRSYSY